MFADAQMRAESCPVILPSGFPPALLSCRRDSAAAGKRLMENNP
jgi:hypothetical protein